MGKVWFDAFTNVSLNFNPLNVIAPRITNANFMRKYVTVGAQATGTTPATNPTVDLRGVTEGVFGRTVFIVVDTENMQGDDVTIELIRHDDGTNDILSITDGTADVASFTATVGDTTALEDVNGANPYGNLVDFKDKAIYKIDFRPHTRADFDTWAQQINTATDPEIKLQVKPANNGLFVNYGTAGNSTSVTHPDGHIFGHYDLENKNVYEIYHGDNLFNTLGNLSGSNLRRRIGKINNNWARVNNFNTNDPKHVVVYFYHDDNDNEHEVCETNKIKRRAKIKRNVIPPINQRGNSLTPTTTSYTANRNAGEDISAHTLTYYQFGTLGQGDNGDKWYENQNNDIFLVNADILQTPGIGPQTFVGLNYISSHLTITYGFEDTRRRHVNPDLFAGFIGAIAELNLNPITQNAYVTTEGFAYEDGSCYPSSMHRNGESVDTHYFLQHGQLEIFQQPFISALHDYGFGVHYMGCSMNYTHGTRDCSPCVGNCVNYGQIHDNHLHSGNFNSATIKTII